MTKASNDALDPVVIAALNAQREGSGDERDAHGQGGRTTAGLPADRRLAVAIAGLLVRLRIDLEQPAQGLLRLQRD